MIKYGFLDVAFIHSLTSRSPVRLQSPETRGLVL
jgi:hypothetical protein